MGVNFPANAPAVVIVITMQFRTLNSSSSPIATAVVPSAPRTTVSVPDVLAYPVSLTTYMISPEVLFRI